MRTPTIDTSAVVLGTLMTLTPRAAHPFLGRLDPDDFTEPPARQTFTLLGDLTAAGPGSLDPATLLGYAQHTAAAPGEHRFTQLTRWVLDAYPAAVPAVALDFHIGLLTETTYRRRITAAAARLAQIANHTTLPDLDTHITDITADLTRHRARIDHTTALRAADHAGRAA